MRKKLAFALAAVVLLAAGLAAAYALTANDPPGGGLDTELRGVSVSVAEPDTTTDETTTTEPAPPPPAEKPELCWKEFGGNPQRTLALPDVELGRPRQRSIWAKGVGGLMEYPPSFCDGVLYVNTQTTGKTIAIDAETGKTLWTRNGGRKASTPAIAGDRLIVSAQDGTVTAFNRKNGHTLWKLATGSIEAESSPVVLGNTAYFGTRDGRLFAVNVTNGSIKWAYNTGGRINASPSIWGTRICISTYAGSIFCLKRTDGTKLWSTYIKRDLVRYESFYSSPATNGKQLFTAARTGKLVALDAVTGHVDWTQSMGALTYATPALSEGRVYIGSYSGRANAYSAESGKLLWSTYLGGRITGSGLVVGSLFFVSTIEGKTYGLKTSDGSVVWRFNAGRFVPGIATDRRYYFSMSGLLMAIKGQNSPR
jgi:outer membrane protein assembly factor BamB